MHRIFKRAASAGLAAILLFTQPFAGAAESVEGVGTIIDRKQNREIRDKLFFTRQTLEHQVQGRVEEFYFDLAAGTTIRPIVVNGAYLYDGRLTITDAVAKLNEQGYEVAGAITGDMFSTTYGVPLGLVIREGIVRTSDNGLPAAAFYSNGRAYIGMPGLNITVDAADTSIKVDNINRVRDTGKLTLYTSDFGTITHTSLDGKHVVLSIQGDIRLGQPLSGVVKKVVTGKEAYALQKGEMVLSATGDTMARMASLVQGMPVVLNVTATDHNFDTASYACGGLNRLVKNGVVPETLPKNERAPRTAVGIRPDGSSVYYAVDGRQAGYSNGLSLYDVATRLKAMGCTEVLELDGGGSTSVGMTFPGTTDFTVLNSPSDGSLRKCAGYILFINSTPVTGELRRLFIREGDIDMMIGSQITYNLTATDQNWHAVPLPLTAASLWMSEQIGLFEGRTLRANAPGSAVITAIAGQAIAEANVRVIDNIDSLGIYNTVNGKYITELQPGLGQVYQLEARAMFEGKTIYSQNECFQWSCTGGIGVMTPSGQFIASVSLGATGQIIVTGGGKTVNIPVTIGVAPKLIEDFEGDTAPIYPFANGITFKLDPFTKNAARGRRSGIVSYMLTPGTDKVSLPVNIPLAGEPSDIYMYVKGDGSGHTLSLTVLDTSGYESTVMLDTLKPGGYQAVHGTLPVRAATITGINISRSGQTLEGIFSIDHMVAAWGEYKSMNAPNVTIAMDKVTYPGQIVCTVTAKDAQGVTLKAGQISLTLDGKPLDFSFDESHGIAYAILAEPVNDLHMLTAEVTDVFGNRKRASQVLTYPRSLREDSFYDVSGKWMEGYADFIDRLGIAPSRTEFGLRYFDPSQALLRIEMVEMMVKLMKTDLTRYDSVQLPFTDTATIPATSLPYVKAAYALGLVAGMGQADGSVKLGWNETITKQDFCVIVSGVLPKGYVIGAMAFIDADQTSPYAVEACSTFANMGVLTGNENGQLTPKNQVSRAEAASILTKLFY